MNSYHDYMCLMNGITNTYFWPTFALKIQAVFPRVDRNISVL